MEEKKQDGTGKIDDVQKIEVAQQPDVKASVLDYDTPGLLVGSAKRKQEATEKQVKTDVAASVEKEVVKEPEKNLHSEGQGETAFGMDEVGRFSIKYALISPILGFAKSLNRPEMEIVFEKNGLSGRFIDPAHVAMGSFFISRYEFTQYMRKDDKDWKVGIDIKKILDLKIRSRDEIDIVLVENPLDEGTRVHRYRIRYQEVETSIRGLTQEDGLYVPKIPKITMRNSVLLERERVWSFFKAAEQVSDAFRVTLDKEGLKLTCKTDDTTIKTVIPKKDMTVEMTDAETTSAYSIEWVMPAFKNLREIRDIKISLGSNDYPMKIDFLKGMVKMDDSVVSLLVAPRVS